MENNNTHNMTPELHGKIVDELNAELNSGRGISAIADVAYSLKIGDTNSAKATIINEWDKISSYPEVAEYLISVGLYEPVDFSKYVDNED